MRHDLSDRLAECLSAAEAGGPGPDLYPDAGSQDEAACRELVSLALELRRMPAQSPSAAFRSAGYGRLMKEIEETSSRRRRPALLPAAARGPVLASTWVSLLLAVALCLGTVGGVLAAEHALPGDRLYGVKTAVEEARLAAAPTQADVTLHAHFAARRLAEAQALVAAGRLGDARRAAAGYETQVEQALQGLTTLSDTGTGTRDRLAGELDRTLAEQAAAWDALAGQSPEQMAPAIRQAQSASSEARQAIRQLRTEPGTAGAGEPTGLAPAEPLPTITPSPTPAEPLPTGAATEAPAGPGPGTPSAAPDRPTPAGTAPVPPAQPTAAGTPPAPPVEPPAGVPAEPPLDGTAPVPPATPAEPPPDGATGAPPPAPLPDGTAAAPPGPPPGGAPLEPPPDGWSTPDIMDER